MKRKLVLPAGAAVAVVAAVVVALSHLGPAPQTSADNASQLMDMVLCEGAGGYNDPLCPPAATTGGDGDGIIEVGENPAVVTRLLIDPPLSDLDQPLFSVAYSTWTGLVPGVGFTDGAIVGKADLTIQSNLTSPGSSNVSALTGQPPICDAEGAIPGTTLEDTLNLYDADLVTGTLVATTDENGSGFADDQEDLLDATGAAGPNGLLDGIDLMPDRLALDVIPKIEAATGAGAPIARAFGVAELARVASDPVYRSVNYLTFVLPDGKYLGVTVVGYPGGARRECGDPASNILEQTVLLCPPSDTRIYLYGITQDNTEACDTDGCAGSPDPSIPGGDMNRTAVWEGKFTYATLIPTDANYDGDMAAGSFDTCTDTVSIDSDLQPYPKGETDPGDMGDRWDSSCDVAPATSDNSGDTVVSNTAPLTGTLPNDVGHCNQPYVTLCAWDCDQDVDGDTYLNTVDNCPLLPDIDVLNEDLDGNPATGVDWQLDSDGDTVGDICDPEPNIPGDGNGYFIDAHPHGLDTGGDPPGGAGHYHDHDFRCTDGFAIPGVEVEGDSHACEAVVDSGNDSRIDWEDLDDDGYFDVGEPVAVLSDSDSDDYTDGCEAVKDTDPLEPASVPGPAGAPGNCDGDSLSDAEEVAQGSDFSEPGVATVTPTPTGTPVWKPVAEAECTHRVVGGDPTEVDIVCHLSDEELDGQVYDWEIIYNDQVPTWPDPPLEPVECTLTDPDTGVQSPSSWTGLIIDMDGDSVVETAKCRDVAVADPWVVSECRDMHVRVAGDATIGSPIEIHLTDAAQNNIGVMESVESPDLPLDCSPIPIEIEGVPYTDPEGRPVVFEWRWWPVTVRKQLGAPDGVDSAYLTLTDPYLQQVGGWMTYQGGGYWVIEIDAYGLDGGIAELEVVAYKDGGPVDTESIEVVLWDPSGLLVDSCTLAGIEGASATLYYFDPALETFVVMDPATYPGMLSPEVNPQLTNYRGHYGWDVVDGDYYVQAAASGYDVVDSPTVTVPPPVTDLDILLTPLMPPDSDGDTLDDCVDTDDDNDGLSDSDEFNTHGTDPLTVDTDGDGCADSEELPGAPAPKPGSTGAYDPLAWYDFYDVPVPSRVDPDPNGPKNQVVDMGDVLAVLFYAFAEPTGVCGDNPNANGLDYDCNKGVDTDGDTVADIPPDGVPDGRDYDRSASAEPNPPWEAGEPNGIVDIGDVLAVLAQAFAVDCSGPP